MAAFGRRIDHVVLAVRDLDGAGEFYRRLGFRVGARNRHPWGTENRLVQFRSSFVELITVGSDASSIPPHWTGHFSFGAFVRDFLERREGFAMVVLDSRDAVGDADRFAKAGAGRFEPFHFERKGRRPDGSETHVAFSLAFAKDEAMPDVSFFVCQQHYPENFWSPELQRHPNGAVDIRAVILRAPEPQVHAPFLAAYSGSQPRPLPETGGVTLPLGEGGRIEVLPGGSAGAAVSYAVAVSDLQAVEAMLEDAGTSFDRHSDAITVRAGHAFGVDIRFESART